MRRIFALLFLAISIVACNKVPGSNDCTSENQEAGTECTLSADPATTDSSDGSQTESPAVPPPAATPESTTSPTTGSALPNSAYTFDTNIDFINTSATQQDKFDMAIEIIKKVIATEEFRDKVIGHTYNGSKTYVDNGGFSNEQIYQKILDGAETLKPVKNNTMDMTVELYYAATSTVGYTYPNVSKIWVNTKYFNTNSVTSVSANLMHEWLHKLGFKHAVSYSISRDYSVPYAIGRMVGSIGKQFD